MKLREKIDVLVEWGKVIRAMDSHELNELCLESKRHNAWFTDNNILLAIRNLGLFLDRDKLQSWIAAYDTLEKTAQKKVGLVMAGNIPMVGFHDFLSVIISNHQLKAKLSDQDPILIPYLTEKLIALAPELSDKIDFVHHLKDIDAVIATGSDNTARYFNYYFSKYPHIIRKNRSSCAVLNGKESIGEFHALGNDIFQYYGLGCRNISKIYVPIGYEFGPMLDALESFNSIAQHHKYQNNYDYNKSLLLINGTSHLDNGFLLLSENVQMVSPISVIYYEYYKDENALLKKMEGAKQKIQCITSLKAWFPESIDFGESQSPELWDYADKVDTLQFLSTLE